MPDEDDKYSVRTVSTKPAEVPKQTQLYYKDGKPIPVEDVGSAVDRGEAFSTGDDVTVREGDRSLAVGRGELANVLARGASVETQAQQHLRQLREDAESVPGMAKTAGEGLARGASLGFLDPALFYDSEGREAAAARQRFNPMISGGSELAGAIGGGVAASMLTGGAAAPEAAEGTGAALARLGGRAALSPWLAADAVGGAAERGVAGLVGDGVLGTGAKMAARGGAEGSVMGVGHEVSQSVLEDKPLTAERLLAGAWEGAAGGMILGGGIGVLGTGLGKAGRSLLGRITNGESVESAAKSWAERRAFKQVTGNARKFFDEATDFGSNMKRPERIGRKLLDAEIPEETGAPIRTLGERTEEAAGRLKSIAGELDGAGVKVNTNKILSQVDDQIAKIRETPSAAYQRVASRIEREIKPFRKAVEQGEDYSFSDLWGLRQKLDKTVKWESKQRGPAEEALKDMVGAFRSELDDSIERSIAADSTGAVPRAETSPVQSTETPSGGVLDDLGDFGDVAGKAANDATPTGQVSPDLLGRWKQAKEDYADFALAKKAAKDLNIRNEKNRFFSPSDYGTGGMAGMLVGILTGHMGIGALAGAATSAAVGAAHKLIRERGAGVLARIADRSASVAGRMEMAAKVAALVESPKRLAPAVGTNVHQMFERYTAALGKSDADVAKHLGDATADLGLRYPEVASEVQKTMLDDRAYLKSKEPQPTTSITATLTPKAAKSTYSFDDKKAFVDAALALDNPMGVFEDLARGELPLVKIETLKIRRPGLWNEMRTTVATYTVKRDKALPYNRRILLGTAFEYPSDWSMLHVASIQDSLSTPDKSKNDPTAAPSKVNQTPGDDITPGGF